MLSLDIAPNDDPVIPCSVRLWKGTSVVVFVHPREWKLISISGGAPLLVECCERVFPCVVRDVGEHFRTGRPDGVVPQDFGVPTHADYPAIASIDWLNAVPEDVLCALTDSSNCMATWKSLSVAEMRKHLSHIFRARTEPSLVERRNALIRFLDRSGEGRLPED